MTELRCERCGAAFDCGAGTGSCWCAELELSDAARARVAGEFDGCLCPACLAEAAQPPAGSEPLTLRRGRTSALGAGS
jgi:hypothetical protein